jgi:hypothetical protein
MNEAAAYSQHDIVRFLHEHRTEGCTVVAMDNAAQLGYLVMLTRLYAHRTEGCSREAAIGTVEHRRLAVVLWLQDWTTMRPEPG